MPTIKFCAYVVCMCMSVYVSEYVWCVRRVIWVCVVQRMWTTRGYVKEWTRACFCMRLCMCVCNVDTIFCLFWCFQFFVFIRFYLLISHLIAQAIVNSTLYVAFCWSNVDILNFSLSFCNHINFFQHSIPFNSVWQTVWDCMWNISFWCAILKFLGKLIYLFRLIIWHKFSFCFWKENEPWKSIYKNLKILYFY